MNFGDRAFWVGVEYEGGVGALIAIEVGEGQAVSFALFGQMAEGSLDVVGDGRGRLLSLQRISLGEKLGGVRALDGQREVAGGVGAEGVGRVEEDEFAVRAHVPGEGIKSFFRRVESFELLFDVVGEEILLASRILGTEGVG